MICELEHKIFTIEHTEFKDFALALFEFQYNQNPVYREFIHLASVDVSEVDSLQKIPFLPVDFFKSHHVTTTSFQPEAIFQSSGTTQMAQSRHLVKKISVYEQSFTKGFQQFFGSPSGWCILGLLPGYLERSDSSLVFMVNELIRLSDHPKSGFYLHDHLKINTVLAELEREKQKTLLIGVTFALLDFAEKFAQPLHHTIVMETGGMKGRKEEMTRMEVHNTLKNAWNLPFVHSEYGMTELLSQAYSVKDGIFTCPPWMKVLVREDDDPFIINERGKGLINVVDLANIYSCSFIATDDIGEIYPNGHFAVQGRRDNSDLRGCSLLSI